MSGGEAFIFDEEGDFALRLNQENMRLHSLSSTRDRYMVKRLMENHYLYTKSAKAKRILDNWQEEVQKFVKVISEAYAALVERFIRQGRDIRFGPPPKPEQSEAA